jgi:hypothetical protein
MPGRVGPKRKDGNLLPPERGSYDILKRTYSTTAYDFKNIQGWIDIELYFVLDE